MMKQFKKLAFILLILANHDKYITTFEFNKFFKTIRGDEL